MPPRKRTAASDPWSTSPTTVAPLTEPLPGWRIDAAWGRSQNRAQLGPLVNAAQPSTPAVCRLAKGHGAPAADCSCGYRIARNLSDLAERLTGQVGTPRLQPGGVAMALVRVVALGSVAGVDEAPGVLRVAGLGYGGETVLHESVGHLAGRVGLRFGGTVTVVPDLFAYAAER